MPMGPYGLRAVKDELLRMIVERKQDEAIKRQIQQQQFENNRTLSRDTEQTRQFNETQKRLDEAANETRKIQMDVNLNNRVNQVVDDTPPDSSISEQTATDLEKTGRGGLVRTNPAYAFPGFLRSGAMDATARDVVPGQQEGRVFTGTAGQLQARDTAAAVERDRIADNQRFDAAQAETIRHNRASEAAPQGPQPGYQWVNRNGQVTYTNQVQPGDTPHDKTTGDNTAGPSDYAILTAERTIKAVDEVLPKIGITTAGPMGAIASYLPGTNAANVSADLSSVASNVAFNALQAMREASKTGGALGQVSERELDLLSSVEGSIRQNQSPANLRKNLQLIKESQQRWLAAARAAGGGGSPAPGAEPSEAPPSGGEQEFDWVPGKGLVPRTR